MSKSQAKNTTNKVNPKEEDSPKNKQSKGSALSFNIDIEYLFPLIDIYTSILIRNVNGLHQIDLHAYAEQSRIYLQDGQADYSKLVGETGPIQYPAASLYIYSFFNYLTNYNITKQYMSNVHMVVDVIRMWLLVRIYKVAFGKQY